MEDFEKKYNETIAKMQNLINEGKKQGHIIVRIEDIEEAIPELKDSENEKIRKRLMNIVKMWKNGGYACCNEDEIDTILAWLEKQKDKKQCEHKPTDKAEPKFKVGDYIKHNKANIICKLISVNSGSYYVENIETNGRIELFNAEQNFHLWTIQDVKDGDVLVASDNSIFIFKGTIDCACKHYVALTTDGAVKFNKGLEHLWETSIAVHPATKEQRKQLEKAMSDAGYTFDFDKKELKLKKIEQKSAWSDLDEISLKETIAIINTWIEYKNKTAYKDTEIGKQSIEWLQSLKGRVQPRQKWSEEDEYTLGETIQHLEELIRIEKVKHCGIDVQYYQRDIDWLKSLKHQNTWKPNDKQLEALESATENCAYSEYQDCLRELIGQLKKLREE